MTRAAWFASLPLLAALALPAAAQTHTPAAPVTVFAAGSLAGAFRTLLAAFTQQTGIAVVPTFGSSGLLRAKIEGGASADLFASADVANPSVLHDRGLAGPVTVFARNRMCLLVKTAAAGSRDVATIMLDPSVRLVTSTPKADPAGDYAEAIFAKLDAQRPGAAATLDAKALRLVGGPDAVVPPPGADLGTYLLLTADRGDAFLAYCSGFVQAAAANPAALRSLEMPPALGVRADYGLALRPDAPTAAERLRAFILSDAGQTILEADGFSRAGR